MSNRYSVSASFICLHGVVRRMLVCLFLCLAGMAAVEINAQEKDSDGDGLSDFQEQHKYLTDPAKSDSDGDGVPDGDWKERREYQYTVRSVVQVMKPVTIEFLNDDYQDARLLDETEKYVEMEVIHYPFNTVASTIGSDPDWRKTIQDPSLELGKWLEPGATSDWTPKLREEIRAELAKSGIEVDQLNDRQLVESASKWLLKRAEYQDGFSCFSTAFDENGKPYVPEAMKSAVGRDSDLTPEEQWEIEISAAGMFRNQKRGSCSSSAIYLNGCLRALGMPTRTILCIPIVDANDESEIRMIQMLQQPAVRRDLSGAIGQLKGSWASHTYNEVFVDGRWRRLNYDRLGQNIYDPGMFGLMTHVATFHDWADAKMHETIGARQASRANDVFGGPNPYSTISLRDSIGEHCKIEMPKAEQVVLNVERIHWTDSNELPPEIKANCQRKGRFGLIAEVTGFRDQTQLRQFLANADMRVHMEVAEEVDQPDPEPGKSLVRLGVGFDAGCYWISNNLLRIYVPFGKGDQRDLIPDATYRFRPQNRNPDSVWKTSGELTISRAQD